MSDESTECCAPTPDQRRMLVALLARAGPLAVANDWLDSVRVESLCDGGMGSFRVRDLSAGAESRAFGRVAAELSFQDADGVLVLVSLNVNDRDVPIEVDVWRTDFGPVIQWPDDLSL